MFEIRAHYLSNASVLYFFSSSLYVHCTAVKLYDLNYQAILEKVQEKSLKLKYGQINHFFFFTCINSLVFAPVVQYLRLLFLIKIFELYLNIFHLNIFDLPCEVSGSRVRTENWTIFKILDSFDISELHFRNHIKKMVRKWTLPIKNIPPKPLNCWNILLEQH